MLLCYHLCYQLQNKIWLVILCNYIRHYRRRRRNYDDIKRLPRHYGKARKSEAGKRKKKLETKPRVEPGCEGTRTVLDVVCVRAFVRAFVRARETFSRWMVVTCHVLRHDGVTRRAATIWVASRVSSAAAVRGAAAAAGAADSAGSTAVVVAAAAVAVFRASV